MSAAVYPRTEIRLMRPSDLKAVARIEQAAYDYPWSQGIFRDCLLAGYHSLVIDLSGIIIGYGIMSIAAAEAHILNICVHPDLQRRGYGRHMLNALLEKAEQTEAVKVFLEVRPSNHAALELYRTSGFDQIGIRPAYYQADRGREDAVVLALTLRSPD